MFKFPVLGGDFVSFAVRIRVTIEVKIAHSSIMGAFLQLSWCDVSAVVVDNYRWVVNLCMWKSVS